MRGRKVRRSAHSIFMQFQSNGSAKSSLYGKATSLNASITTVRTSTSMSTLVTTTGIPPLTTTALNCGYNCSRFIYNQPVTRHSYDILTNEERAVIKEKYYKNYDLMTGLRTAASLGGTILLFSLFILYKMKCRSFRRRKSLATIHGNGVTLYDTGDVAKEPSFSNGNPSLLTEIKVSGVPVFINNASCGSDGGDGGGSRRSSKVVLSAEGFNESCSRNTGPLLVHSGAESSAHVPRIGGRTGLNAPTSPVMLSGSNYSLMSICKSGLEDDLPRFRLNSESDSCGFGAMRLPVARVDSFLTEPTIDIHIIQPTPNVSPCGSMRRISEDVATFAESLNRPDPATVFIPLLSIPKSGCRHSKGKCGASKSKCSKRSSCHTQDTQSDHLSSCDPVFACRASTSTAIASGCPISAGPSRPPRPDEHNAFTTTTTAITSSNNCENSVCVATTETMEIKFIDCSDSDVHSSLSSGLAEKVEGSDTIESPPNNATTIPTCSFNLQLHSVRLSEREAQICSRTIEETFVEDTNRENVSETQF